MKKNKQPITKKQRKSSRKVNSGASDFSPPWGRPDAVNTIGRQMAQRRDIRQKKG